jgi:tRNA (mo5U34)-methyltransferase
MKIPAKRAIQALANKVGYEIRRKGNFPAQAAHKELTAVQIEDYRDRIAKYQEQVRWFHSFDFGHGLVVNGFATADSLAKRLVSLGLPDNLSGMTFLDIASWDGFYAFEAERRGAARVLATDYFCWRGEGWGKKGGFLLAREILNSKVEDKEIEVHDLSPKTVGMWDIVLFNGIFYHMRDPIGALEAAASVAENTLIVETHIDHDDMQQPMMRYLPRCAGNENSNYWRPNSAMILTLLSDLGFPRVEHRIEVDPPGGADSTHGFFRAYRN